MKAFRKYLVEQKKAFPTWYHLRIILTHNRVDDKDRTMLRFLQGNGFNYEKTLKSLEAHIEWRLNNLPAELEDVETYANNGLIYFLGRDKRFRPILHIPVRKIADENVSSFNLIPIDK